MPETTDLQDALIPETCADALARWDAGEHVWSAEFSGIGPGQEQQVQLMAFECVRYLMDKELPRQDDPAAGLELDQALEPICIGVAIELGFGSPSKFQRQAAKNLACVTKRRGWREAIRSLPPDRRILVKRVFP